MRRALNEIGRISPKTNWGFFSYAYIALYNDTLSHEIKILDRHRDAASFWYIYRCDEKNIKALLSKFNLELEKVEKLSDKLNEIGDKTHFHIDKIGVLDPNAVWDNADVKADFINEVFDKLWIILKEYYKLIFGNDFSQNLYDPADIERIINAVKDKGIRI